MLICPWLLIDRLILVCFQEWLISYKRIMQGTLETSWSVCLTWTVQTLSLYWMKAPRRSLTATLTLWHEERTDMDTDLYLTDLEVKVADGILQCLVTCCFKSGYTTLFKIFCRMQKCWEASINYNCYLHMTFTNLAIFVWNL